jgi:hypothetical protein
VARPQGAKAPWFCNTGGRVGPLGLALAWPDPVKWAPPHRRRTAPPAVQRRKGERETISCKPVNKLKFKTQNCKLNFSPSFWPQMKNFLIPFLFSFLRSTTFVLGTFSFEYWFVSYFKVFKNSIKGFI